MPCTVEVNTAGAYGNEVSWTLSDASGNVVASMDGQDESFPSPNTLVDVVTNDPNGEWSMLGSEDDWTVLDSAYLYFTERRRRHHPRPRHRRPRCLPRPHRAGVDVRPPAGRLLRGPGADHQDRLGWTQPR